MDQDFTKNFGGVSASPLSVELFNEVTEDFLRSLQNPINTTINNHQFLSDTAYPSSSTAAGQPASELVFGHDSRNRNNRSGGRGLTKRSALWNEHKSQQLNGGQIERQRSDLIHSKSSNASSVPHNSFDVIRNGHKLGQASSPYLRNSVRRRKRRRVAVVKNLGPTSRRPRKHGRTQTVVSKGRGVVPEPIPILGDDGLVSVSSDEAPVSPTADMTLAEMDNYLQQMGETNGNKTVGTKSQTAGLHVTFVSELPVSIFDSDSGGNLPENSHRQLATTSSRDEVLDDRYCGQNNVERRDVSVDNAGLLTVYKQLTTTNRDESEQAKCKKNGITSSVQQSERNGSSSNLPVDLRLNSDGSDDVYEVLQLLAEEAFAGCSTMQKFVGLRMLSNLSEEFAALTSERARGEFLERVIEHVKTNLS